MSLQALKKGKCENIILPDNNTLQLPILFPRNKSHVINKFWYNTHIFLVTGIKNSMPSLEIFVLTI